MGGIHSTRDVRAFHMMVTVWCGDSETANSCFHYHVHRRLYSIHFTYEADGKIYFNHIYFFNLLLFINLFNWQYFYLTGYDS
jgi:hypothetical protein